MLIESSKIGLQRFLKRQRAGKVIGRKDVALHFAEDNLDLIQPAGIFGQPLPPHLKRQLQRGEPRPELLGGVRGTIIENQMEDFHPRT
jgi:hypothetical protein